MRSVWHSRACLTSFQPLSWSNERHCPQHPCLLPKRTKFKKKRATSLCPAEMGLTEHVQNVPKLPPAWAVRSAPPPPNRFPTSACSCKACALQLGNWVSNTAPCSSASAGGLVLGLLFRCSCSTWPRRTMNWLQSAGSCGLCDVPGAPSCFCLAAQTLGFRARG